MEKCEARKKRKLDGRKRKEVGSGCKNEEVDVIRRVEPSAPPPYAEVSLRPSGGAQASACTFCPQTWREAAVAFPVFEDVNQQRYHEPLDFKVLKNLADSVQAYGVNASFTLAQIERLTHSAMTPSDWMSTVKACLTMGQYLDWKSLYTEFAQQRARDNAAQGQAAWSFDMLMGQGQWSNNQTAYPPQVYAQINTIAEKAWKALPNKGEVSGNLTKIVQGATEPFSDFVARMMEAAGRIFGDPDTAMPLIQQLIFEQCTRESAERHYDSQGPSKGMVKWKDVLTGSWRGPDPVLTWARGSVCVFPQDQQDPVWVPERLVRKIRHGDLPEDPEPSDGANGDVGDGGTKMGDSVGVSKTNAGDA
ncbi:igE-binding protein-like [Grammomys surdaster]|uniref:igE-binding protein-like n=1 Tax=Grammomys surdaster TaxID=491861 RepID=UPI00109EEDCA|nr:igE-binding protein-like [Grammomys surdaster]